MNEIKLYNFNGNNIRVFLNENNEPEFCASDVTNVLGYTNGRKAISDHCKSKGVTKHYIGVQTGEKKDIKSGELRLIKKGGKTSKVWIVRAEFDKWLLMSSILKY